MADEATTKTLTKRADAERNRAKILTAARIAFTSGGADVSMAEISRLAGVGMATLYRNFANRLELLEALYLDEVDTLCQAAQTLEGDTPGAVLTAWLERFVTYFTTKRPVAAELLEHSGRGNPVFGEGRPRVLAAGRQLLQAAQASGEVRADLSLEQILDMVIAVAKIQGDSGYVEPILRAALDGLKPPA